MRSARVVQCGYSREMGKFVLGFYIISKVRRKRFLFKGLQSAALCTSAACAALRTSEGDPNVNSRVRDFSTFEEKASDFASQ